MRFRFAPLVLPVMTVLMVCAQTCWAFTGSYEESITISDKPVAKFKVTAKGKFVKTEFMNDEDPEQVIKNETGTYRVIPNQQVALKLPDLDDKENLLDDMDNYAEFLKQNQAKIIGSETLADKDTDIYEFLDPMTQKNAKAWVWKEKNLPLKIEVQANEGLLLVELLNVDLTTPVEDSVFSLPPEFKIVELKPAGPSKTAQAVASETSVL